MGEVTEFNDEAEHVMLIKAANGSTRECFGSKWMVWICKECESIKVQGPIGKYFKVKCSLCERDMEH
ncbi:hypothetical protein HanOQP8_Chr15g0582791 [Helianthus annuus]|nr:hypothetical protein HanOQP8_Chr15g0582791 [Helianthus annuus]KAJ0957490.1 hypothetical protein HanPSC8_Chr01g0027871 [Helianthus annuus]KAJ0957491.1 hypothetical protein HanPSC8_Chr01g0027881 [Helianthus annuus]